MLPRINAVACLVAIGLVSVPAAALGAAASSPSYSLQESVIGSAGTISSSTNYGLNITGGEAFVGATGTGSNALGEGYVPQLENALSFGVDANSVSIAATPGVAATAQSILTVQTDAPGYQLYVQQDHDPLHTDAITTIPGIPDGMAAPAVWTGGTTGLGISVVGGSVLEPKWGTSPNFAYAALPTTATLVHMKLGYQYASDATTVEYRMRVSSSQLVGTYANTVTYTALPAV